MDKIKVLKGRNKMSIFSIIRSIKWQHIRTYKLQQYKKQSEGKTKRTYLEMEKACNKNYVQ